MFVCKKTHSLLITKTFDLYEAELCLPKHEIHGFVFPYVLYRPYRLIDFSQIGQVHTFAQGKIHTVFQVPVRTKLSSHVHLDGVWHIIGRGSGRAAQRCV